MNDHHNSDGRRRVVITGLGLMTPLGLTVQETWEGLIAGRSGIGPITLFDATGYPSRIAGELKGFEPQKYVGFKEARRMARSSQVAVATAQEAIADAGFSNGWANPERVGVVVGTAMGGFDMAARQMRVLWQKGWQRVSPFALPASIPNMPAFHISRFFGAQGPTTTVTSACATGTQAVGEGCELIRRGAADLVIAGGVEALIHEVAFAGFAAMRALSTRNDEPERASRPFDANRDGFVFSEGAGILILESLDHARARGARIYAEVLGHASASDAYHIAAPDPTGAGAIRAMRWALEDAGLTPDDVDYINAHGTSTPINDAVETLAIKTLFGEQAYNIPISSTKSMLGHPMGGAGAIEAAVCALTLYHGIIHPTINYETPDPQCDLDYVPNEARRANVQVVLSNSFGLGGQNACLVLGVVR